MDPNDIKDRVSREHWLKTLSRESVLGITERAALRVFPLWGGALDEDWAKAEELTSLPLLRLLFTLCAARKSVSDEIVSAIENASAFADATAEVTAGAVRSKLNWAVAAHAARVAARTSAFAAIVPKDEVAYHASPALGNSARSAANADEEYDVANGQAVRTDGETARLGVDLATRRLWPDGAPASFEQADSRVRAIWSRDPETWSFWLRWWDGILAGRSLDWELQRDVALIPDEDWQKGPAHVARLIHLIEERHRLLGLVAELRDRLSEAAKVDEVAAASLQHRRHNHPPELVEESQMVLQMASAIRGSLDDAETELAKPRPEPSALRRIGKTLADAVAAAAIYCGSKLDIFVTKAVEAGGSALGTWGVPALIATWAAPTGTMQQLIKGLFDFASKLAQ